MNEEVAVRERLIEAAHAASRHGLVDAFGHISTRVSESELVITAPIALGDLSLDSPFPLVQLEATTLPDEAPKEAWIHKVIAEARSEVGGIFRAQPPAVGALTAAGLSPFAVDGHAALLGAMVPVYTDSRLVRDHVSARAVMGVLGQANAVILRGNGAVTVGSTTAEAVALMWVLEKTARLILRAAASGHPEQLPPAEQEYWNSRRGELLPRMFRYLAKSTSEGSVNND